MIIGEGPGLSSGGVAEIELGRRQMARGQEQNRNWFPYNLAGQLFEARSFGIPNRMDPKVKRK